jgi:TetR/AcrR family transcriptional regulator
MARRARVSPDRILAAAALEFAERGYAGARVDRIAGRARVNKAMLYYHFHSKRRLYRALLRQTFSRASERLQAIAASDRPPAEKIDRAIDSIAAFIREHAFFPAIMLREVAEGGAHLDRETLATLAAVPRAVSAIIEDGISRRAFRTVHPLAAYFTMLAPLVVYHAGTPIRQELASERLVDGGALTPDLFARHLRETMRRALAQDLSSSTRRHHQTRAVASSSRQASRQGSPARVP